MCEKEWETIEVEIDADLVDKAAEILKPMGLTPQDYFQMCINFMGDPANRELVTLLLLRGWLRMIKMAMCPKSKGLPDGRPFACLFLYILYFLYFLYFLYLLCLLFYRNIAPSIRKSHFRYSIVYGD